MLCDGPDDSVFDSRVPLTVGIETVNMEVTRGQCARSASPGNVSDHFGKDHIEILADSVSGNECWRAPNGAERAREVVGMNGHFHAHAAKIELCSRGFTPGPERLCR